MLADIPYFHFFKTDLKNITPPKLFTYPFCYEPHELSCIAASEVQEYLSNQQDFKHNFGIVEGQEGLVIGKMFGVLVVRDKNNNLGYLAACSGKLGGTNRHKFFVPPIFDMLDESSFFIREEEKINKLNHTIESLCQNPIIDTLKQRLIQVKEQSAQVLALKRKQNKLNKAKRKDIRTESKLSLSTEQYLEVEKDLIKQSHRDQHEYDVLKQDCSTNISTIETELQALLNEIHHTKEYRKELSIRLQQKLFEQYQFLNAKGQRINLLTIFQDTLNVQPPAGAGECAAPKLLQYAYIHNLTPICMAEFWWGAAPSSEIRKHAYFYPSCRGKCEPILNHMLQGLDVEPNPMRQNLTKEIDLNITYEDKDIIVINKPAELLSVPGILNKDSVQTRILENYKDISGPVIIHRLDMSTSGILILAKNKEAHQFIQEQFIKQEVKKRYTALLDGVIKEQEGFINLPLRVDLNDRPRQLVCFEHGKEAKTLYKIISLENNKTRVHFFPITGRTHQLRVHAAHKKGLNTPIVGDDLYGKRSRRLHLHAGYISFIHPTTKKKIEFELPDPF